ncbi:MAG: helix-turn-helix domain-containing protein [Spirosomataceae bacterium]
MKLHKNANLTPKQRQYIKELYATKQYSQSSLATQFGVSRKTIMKWLKRTNNADAFNAPGHRNSKLTPEFIADVKAYREAKATSHHGKTKIAEALSSKHACSNPSNVYHVLKQLKLNSPKSFKSNEPKRTTVKKYRFQINIEQMPINKHKKDLDYKITITNLNNRLSYSEIHNNCKKTTVMEVYQKAMDVISDL